jgi:hypothetical protein
MRKYNLSVILSLSIIATGFVSCKKDPKVNGDASKGNNPISVIKSYFVDVDKQSDFTIFVSTVHPVSLFEQYPISRSATTVEAFGLKGNQNLGELSVNNIPVPVDNFCYYLPVDTPMQHSSQLTGQAAQFNFISNSSNVIPSFNISKYSVKVTNLSYNGLVNSKLARNVPLTISWLPDDGVQNLKGLVVIMGTSETEDATMVTKEVLDNQGTSIITASDLAKFQAYKSIKVYYSRGYFSDEVVNGKTLLFQFINYSWSRINFSN